MSLKIYALTKKNKTRKNSKINNFYKLQKQVTNIKKECSSCYDIDDCEFASVIAELTRLI